MRCVEYYNFVREKTEKCEFDMICGQVEEIDVDLRVSLEKFTWINFGMYSNVRSFVGRIIAISLKPKIKTHNILMHAMCGVWVLC